MEANEPSPRYSDTTAGRDKAKVDYLETIARDLETIKQAVNALVEALCNRATSHGQDGASSHSQTRT